MRKKQMLKKRLRSCWSTYDIGLSGVKAERAVKKYKSHRKIPYSEVERALTN